MTLEDKLQSLIPILFAITVLASALASFVNTIVRALTNAGKTPPGWLLFINTLLNGAAMNLDKASQMVKLMRGGSVQNTALPAPAPVPADPAAPAAAPVDPNAGK